MFESLKESLPRNSKHASFVMNGRHQDVVLGLECTVDSFHVEHVFSREQITF